MPDIREHLRRLINRGTRADPIVFVGRDSERGRVRDTSLELPPDGPHGCTLLIQGPPGCGKTALISRLRTDLEADADVGVMTFLDVPVDTMAENIYGRLASFLVGATSPTRGRTERRQYSGALSLPGLARSAASVSRSETSPSFVHSDAIAGERKGAWSPKQRVVVFMDEIQNVVPGTRIAHLLRDLHTQDRIPVLLVFAGLSNSELALSDAGLSRIENRIHLGRLSDRDAFDCAQRSLRKTLALGVPGSDATVEWWATALAEASDDWPRHLQVYLQATWQALLDQGSPNLDEADIDGVVQSGDDLRESYYKARISASKTPLPVIGALHRSMANGDRLGEAEARWIIGDAVDRLDARTRGEWAASFDDNTGQCFAELLRAGVVSLDAQYRCVSPVPSFSRYILENSSGKSAFLLPKETG